MNPLKEVTPMTNEQADTNRNDLIELMIEKALRILPDNEQRQKLIQEYEALKH